MNYIFLGKNKAKQDQCKGNRCLKSSLLWHVGCFLKNLQAYCTLRKPIDIIKLFCTEMIKSDNDALNFQHFWSLLLLLIWHLSENDL